MPLGGPHNPDLRLVLLVGVGEQSTTDLRRAGAVVARATRDRRVVATSIPALDPTAGIEAFVVGVMLGAFSFSWRRAPAERAPVSGSCWPDCRPRARRSPRRGRTRRRARRRWLACPDPGDGALEPEEPGLAGRAGPAGGRRARPRHHGLGREAARGRGLRRDRRRRAGLGHAAPADPARLHARRRRTRKTPTVVLVGKGITFDTGGLSIKPAQGMVAMKRDMTGGAVVIATMAALAEVGCPVKVVGLVPAAENAVSGHVDAPRRRAAPLRRPHHRGDQHRCRGSAGAGRRPRLRRGRARPSRDRGRRHPDRGIKVALGQQVGGLFANDDALAAGAADGRRALPASRCGGSRCSRPTRTSSPRRSPTPTTPVAEPRPSPQPCSSSTSPARCRGRTSTSRRSVTCPTDRYEWTEGPSGFGARALLTWLGQAEPLAGVAERR